MSIFGRRKRRVADAVPDVADAPAADVEADGPHDFDDVAERIEQIAPQRLDLGSVILPAPSGSQLQVQLGQDGKPQGVHLQTTHGRITVVAFAAPKSPGQWREVVGELVSSLRDAGNTTEIADGPWGRELVASTKTADVRFIGVDGYRWMVQLVAAGPAGAAADGSPLVETARDVLRSTIVRRGTDPHPVRTPLPVQLPKQLVEQLAAAQQQQQAAQAAAAAAANAPVQPQQAPAAPRPPRRGADGSAMQQMQK